MFRYFAGFIVLACAAAASAQVIYLPPPQVEVYNPFYENLSPPAVARLRALSDAGTFARAYGPAVGAFTGYFDRWGNPLVAVRSPLELGIDPQTGQPLYFRKADLLPDSRIVPQADPDQRRGAERSRRPSPPSTRPAGEYPPGTLIIKMRRP